MTDVKDKSSSKTFEENLYQVLADEDGRIHTSNLLENVHQVGIRQTDPRLKETIRKIRKLYSTQNEEFLQSQDLVLDKDISFDVIGDDIEMIEKAFTAELVIPEFKEFKAAIDDLYYRVKSNKGGAPASYIPQLARVNPNYWEVCVCTIDGQSTAGNNMEAVDYDGRSALHLAAAEGQLKCVRFLLETRKVTPNPKDRWGQTPYDDSIKFDKQDVTAYKYVRE